jgi:ribonuclease PH
MFLRNKGLGWVTAEYAMLPGNKYPHPERDPAPLGTNARDTASHRPQPAGG